MEWNMSVNEMLTQEITKVDSSLIPPGFQGDARTIRIVQNSLSKLIDAIGEKSSAAQGLSKVLTTAEKMQNSEFQLIYLLKDANANGGKGEVIGMLKIGKKHLFLFDENDKVCEVEPICILDFFVIQNRQRSGHGKLLFDFMIQDMKKNPYDLAIDGPSPKMEQFLARNYGLSHLIKQNNNFAIAPQFFQQPNITSSITKASSHQGHVGRHTAAKNMSTVGDIIHGGNPHICNSFSRWDRQMNRF